MPLSVESLFGAKESWRAAQYASLISALTEMRESSPSAGDFSLKFVHSLALIIEGSSTLSGLQRDTITQLCKIVEFRPFPTMPWAKVALRYLDNPRVLADKLELFLEDKRLVKSAIGEVAARNAAAIGLRPHATVFVFGFSYMFSLIFPALPGDIRSTLRIWTPKHIRRQTSEGCVLKEALLQKEPNLHVEVIDDRVAIAKLRNGEADTFVMSAKAIGLHNGHLSIINTFTEEDLPRIAHEHCSNVVVTSGRYKIWPKDLFGDYAACVTRDPRRYDAVIPAKQISCLLTEDDVFSPSSYRTAYDSPLTTDLSEYPGWVSEQHASDAVDRRSKLIDKRLLGTLTGDEAGELDRLESTLDDEEAPFFKPASVVLGEHDLTALNEQYSLLVDKKYVTGLTEGESRELAALSAALDLHEATLYEPIKQRLRQLLARRS